MKTKTLKTILFVFIMAFLLAPLTQQVFHFIKSKPLSGAIEKNPEANFNFSDWVNTKYQEKEEKYLNQNFGFRDDYVRLNNQIAYSVWKEARANGIVIGKNNYLYEENYIKAYYGTDFVGEKEIYEKVEKIKFLQDTLKKLNIDLLLIFAAGKGTFYPEYFPDKYKTLKGRTNLAYYLQKCKQLNIHYIDFNTWFLNNKYKSAYPLYPQYGIHWSSYGWALAADSIIKYIENLKEIDLPDLTWNEVEVTDKLRDNDYDIASGMNLIFQLPTFKMGYPKFIFEENAHKKRPNVLAIADSYYWQMFSASIPKRIFNNGKFWFYNKEIYPDSFDSPLDVSQVDLKKEIEKQDVIILMATDATLPKFGWGFIENAYKIYSVNEQEKDKSYEAKVKECEQSIKKSPDWLRQVKAKAIIKNIPLDSMIRLDAIWVTEKVKAK